MSRIPEFHQIHVFMTVAKYLSFAQASKVMNVTPPAITTTINNLEQRLEVRLFHRSTRSVSLTEKGRAFLESMTPIYEQYINTCEEFTANESTPKGKLKISIPRIVQDLFFEQVFIPFKKQYPKIELEVLVSDGFVSIVDEGFDFGIRFYESIPKDMIAIRFESHVSLRPFASPLFLKEYGCPKNIDELSLFNCIQRQFPSGENYAWEFFDEQKHIHKKTKGNLIVNTDQMMIQAALNHLGIIYVYDSLVAVYESSGRLERILNQYEYPSAPFYLYYATRENISHAARCFIEWIKQSNAATGEV